MKRPLRHVWTVTGICAVCTAVVLVLWWVGFVPLTEAENYTQDLRTRFGRKTVTDPRLMLIGVDRPSYADYFDPAEVGQSPVLQDLTQNYPWSREVWAELITRLAEAGAKAIVIDLVFAAPKDGDDALAQALDKYRDRVVIGCNLGSLATDRGEFMKLDLPSPTVLAPAGNRSVAEDDRVGYVNIWPDLDGVLRHASYRRTGNQLGDVLPPDTVLESLDARALRKFGRPDLIPAGFEPRLFRYTAPPGYGFKPVVLGDVLSPKTWRQNFGSGEAFRGKIVLIGPTANLFQDKHRTPFAFPAADMLGPEIHLNLINAALHGEFLRETPPAASALAIAGAGFLAAALCFLLRQPVKRLLVVLLLCTGYWALADWDCNHAGLVLPLAAPLLVLFIGSVTALTFDFLLEQLDKARVRKTLERYVSKNVVREVLDNPQTYFNSLTGVRKPVTILFSDVRGFTTLTESADSAALVKQLNEYFEEMVALVFAREGSLDKFIGDAVMAVWGNIVSKSPAHDAQQAVATALAMRRSLAVLNEDWKRRGMLELHFGIGLNHGEVIVGNLGSTEKMELTVIGDAVNLASRLEGLTKEYHLDLLLGESVARLVRDQYLLRLVDCVQVKGKTKPVDVFTVTGDGAGQTVSLPLWLARYEEGVQQYRRREFAAAARRFEESLRAEPDDYLSAMYLQRCRNYLAHPPGDDWDGVFVMTKK
jgi:adenylate cyclase